VLRKSKVNKLDVTVVVYHHIVRLEVSVNNVVRVQPLKRYDDLCKVEDDKLSPLGADHLQLGGKHAVQVLAFDVLERKADVVAIRECLLKLYDEFRLHLIIL
jgi:hypothetical protein